MGNAMNMGLLMGMGMVGMPPGLAPSGLPPGIPPMGLPPVGLPPLVPGLPPGTPLSGEGGAEGSGRRKRDKSRRPKEKGSSEEEGEAAGREEDGQCAGRDSSRSRSSRSVGSASAPRRRRAGSRRRRGRDREPERIEEVERFLDENRINEEAALKIRALSPASQRRVIARPLTGDVQNPSKVMIARVRELQSQNDRAKGKDLWSAWGSVMMGATPEAMNKYIEDNDLDESASRQLRSLPPHHQAVALRWDLSSYRNPSAKFMSMACVLAASPAPRMPVPAMYAMPPPMYGMPGRPPIYSMMPSMGMPSLGMPPGVPGMMPPQGISPPSSGGRY